MHSLAWIFPKIARHSVLKELYDYEPIEFILTDEVRDRRDFGCSINAHTGAQHS